MTPRKAAPPFRFTALNLVHRLPPPKATASSSACSPACRQRYAARTKIANEPMAFVQCTGPSSRPRPSPTSEASNNGTYSDLVGLNDLYEFDLVPEEPGGVISTDRWPAMQHRLLQFQPARSAVLIGDPPTALSVLAFGGTEVAPGLLADLELFAGTRLRVVPRPAE